MIDDQSAIILADYRCQRELFDNVPYLTLSDFLKLRWNIHVVSLKFFVH